MKLTRQLRKKLKKELGAELVEYTLVVSLIAMSCIGGIEAFTKDGILGAFCLVLHAESDIQVLIDENKYNPETGACSGGEEGDTFGEFDGWGDGN